MKESRKTLKLKAKRALLGRYPTAVGALLLTGLLLMAVMVAAELGIITAWGVASMMWEEEMGAVLALSVLCLLILGITILMCMMVPGYFRMYLNICEGKEARALNIFWGFGHQGGKFFGMALLLALIGLLLMVPEILFVFVILVTKDTAFPALFLIFYQILLCVVMVYAALTYGLTYVILADDPKRPLLEALRESRRLMKGSRGRLFIQGLSFLGWFVIVYITGGLAILWLMPYIMCTNVFFYLNLKEIHKPVSLSSAEDRGME